jgi:hypothetical protein
MPKTKIRSPRRPRDESAAVTIGNLELQVRNLTARCAELVEFRDEWQRKYHAAISAIDERDSILLGVQGQRDIYAEQLADSQRTVTRMEGWMDCAREIMVVR